MLRVELPPTLVAALPLSTVVEPPVAIVMEAVADADDGVELLAVVELAVEDEEDSVPEFACEEGDVSHVSGPEELLPGQFCALAMPLVRAVVARTLKYFIVLLVLDNECHSSHEGTD